jgi:hypothetical protein
VPAVPELTVRIDEPEPCMAPALKAAVRPAVGAIVKMTVPVNPFNAVIVIVEVVDTPVLGASVEGFTEIVKSTTANVAVVLWTTLPLVPVMVRMYVDAVEELQEKVAVPLVTMLVDENAPQFSPGGTVMVRATVPVNP